MAVVILATLVVTFMVVLGLRNQSVSKDEAKRTASELVLGTHTEESRDQSE